MEFHKPKPWHGWRGFVKEYAIIVVGVLTALAAEQGVEWLHWQSEVKTARAALAAEFALNDTFFARRVALGPCLDRQNDEAEGIIADLQARKPPRRFTTFHPGAGAVMSDSEWQSQRASQTLTHFPHAELALMNRYYALLPDFRAWIVDEGNAGRELSILQDPPPGLDLATLMRLKVSLATARGNERLIVLNAARQLRLSRQLGHPAPAAEPERVKAFCSESAEGYSRFIDSNEPRDNP